MRPWILSFLVVALGVGTVLWMWDADPAARSTHDAPETTPAAPAGPILDEAAVRAYLDVYPRIQNSLGRMGRNMQEAARQGKTLDTERIGAEMRAQVESWLRPHHLTPQDFDDVRRRVEFVVDCERWERERPERERDLRETIDGKRSALEAATTDKERETLRAEIDRFESQFGVQAPPVSERDLALVRSFWAELDRIAVRSPSQRGYESPATPSAD